MKVTRFNEAPAYVAPNHFDMRSLRLQGFGAHLNRFALGLECGESLHVQEALRVLAGFQARHGAGQVWEGGQCGAAALRFDDPEAFGLFQA